MNGGWPDWLFPQRPAMPIDDGSMRQRPWQQPGFQGRTGGVVPPHMLPSPNTGGPLPPQLQVPPMAGTGGPGQVLPAFNANTGGGAPMVPQGVPYAQTGGGAPMQPVNAWARMGENGQQFGQTMRNRWLER